MAEKTLDEKMIDLIRDGCHQVARLRRISYADALDGHIRQCKQNEEDSRGSTEATYWRRMKELADNELARQLHTGITPHPVLDEEAQPRLV